MQKLKSAVAVRASLKHAFREQDTPNADPSRTPNNTHIGAKSAAEAMQKFNAALPEKVRKNAVLAVEYLITGSPDVMQGKTRQEQDAYFQDALKWLKAKHGAENLLYAGVHRDESTPHLYAYIVPKDANGKLNCRAVLGGHKSVLSDMQTDFAAKVGAAHGLERGVKGSKAKHMTVSQHYARLNQAAAAGDIPRVAVPEPTLTDRLKPKEYGERVAKAVITAIKPSLERAAAKAAQGAVYAQRAQETQAALEALRKRSEPFLDAIAPLAAPERELVLRTAQEASSKLQAAKRAEKERLEQERIRAAQEAALERERLEAAKARRLEQERIRAAQEAALERERLEAAEARRLELERQQAALEPEPEPENDDDDYDFSM